MEPSAKTGSHVKITSADDVPRDAIRGWLRIAVARARMGNEALPSPIRHKGATENESP